MIPLGERVRDIVNGFEGLAVSRVESLFGVCKIEVERTDSQPDGMPYETIWVAESRLELVGEHKETKTAAHSRRV